MNDAIKEQISAFVDGELPDAESELLLKRLSDDAELRSEAARMLSLGSVLRGDLPLASLRARVAAEIADEPPMQMVSPVANAPAAGRFMRPLVGVAVAASVAVMALVGLRQIGPEGDVAPSVLRDLSAVAIDAGLLSTEPPLNDLSSVQPSDRLTQYYLSHGQASSNLGSRLVGLEVREDRLTESPESDDTLEPDAEELTTESPE